MCKYFAGIVMSIRQVKCLEVCFGVYKEFSVRLFELVARHLDLDSLLEFFEQMRLLTETPVPKRTTEISPSLPQNLFPMHAVIERVGDMTLGKETKLNRFVYRNKYF